jgi:hypothetical protein
MKRKTKIPLRGKAQIRLWILGKTSRVR